MATQIQLFRGGSYEEIDYSSFEVELGVSTRVVAPTASFRTHSSEPVSPAQSARIRVDGTTIYEGSTKSGGTKGERGQTDVEIRHPVAELWNSTADVSLASPTDEEVLEAALTNADTTASFTLSYAGTATALDDAYEVDDRSVRSIFRDMVDRTDRVWWVDPAGTTIHVQAKGGRGLWQSLDGTSRGVSVQQFDSGNVETVRNAVTVIGTGDEAVSVVATDSGSISTYGRRSGDSPYNVSYITSASEALAVANALLQPTPVPEGEVQVASNVGDITQPLVNQTVDVADDAKNIDASGLLVESQTIEQGRVTLTVGGGVGESVAEANRDRKSRGDITAPGSVYNSDRIADGAIAEQKLVDGSVIEDKLADLSVSLQKVQDGAISETKVQDDSISTPKLQAEAVTAAKILADTITANEIAADTITALEIAGETITANEIAANTITAALIDTLDLETDELTIGTDADAQIAFSTGTTGTGETILDMNPTAAGLVRLGASTPFDSIQTDGLSVWDGADFTGALTLDPDSVNNSIEVQDAGDDTTELRPLLNGGCYIGRSDRVFAAMHATEFLGADGAIVGESAGTPAVYPETDGTGLVGFIGQAWSSMRAGSYFNDSPLEVSETDADIDLEELCACGWYDPPEYVREGTARKQAETEGFPDEDAAADGALPDPDGVELGTMANYLLEVAIQQQEHIDDLTTRVDGLEARLEALESRNA